MIDFIAGQRSGTPESGTPKERQPFRSLLQHPKAGATNPGREGVKRREAEAKMRLRTSMANHVARQVRQMHKLRYFIIIVPNSAWHEKRALQSEERSFPSLTAIISTN